MKLIVFILISLCAFNCKEHPTQPTQPAAPLTVLDASCIEAWIKISATTFPETVSLLRNDSTVLNVTLAQQDTIVVDRNLLPTHTYTYKTRVLATGVTSDGVKATTMDTTSNNFTFEIDTLSTSITNPGMLVDVAIINDTLAYAVGNIAAIDSTGASKLYNVAIWNGVKWELKSFLSDTRILYPGSIGDTVTFAQGSAIFAFNENDIWIAAGCMFHFDGSGWAQMQASYAGIQCRLWGTSSSQMWCVEAQGKIIYHTGNDWQQVQSGTTMWLSDIYGANGKVLVAGSNDEYAQGIILNLNGSTCTTVEESDLITSDQLFKPKLYGEIATVWIDEKNAIYAGGNLLFWNKFNQWDYVRSLPENYLGGNQNVFYRGFIGRIRGNASNDLWIGGDRNTLRHFNGATWTQVGLPYDPNSAIAWPGLAVRGNLCIATGENGRLAIAVVIRRK
jgi:hypothetical protein